MILNLRDLFKYLKDLEDLCVIKEKILIKDCNLKSDKTYPIYMPFLKMYINIYNNGSIHLNWKRWQHRSHQLSTI